MLSFLWCKTQQASLDTTTMETNSNNINNLEETPRRANAGAGPSPQASSAVCPKGRKRAPAGSKGRNPGANNGETTREIKPEPLDPTTSRRPAAAAAATDGEPIATTTTTTTTQQLDVKIDDSREPFHIVSPNHRAEEPVVSSPDPTTNPTRLGHFLESPTAAVEPQEGDYSSAAAGEKRVLPVRECARKQKLQKREDDLLERNKRIAKLEGQEGKLSKENDDLNKQLLKLQQESEAQKKKQQTDLCGLLLERRELIHNLTQQLKDVQEKDEIWKWKNRETQVALEASCKTVKQHAKCMEELNRNVLEALQEKAKLGAELDSVSKDLNSAVDKLGKAKTTLATRQQQLALVTEEREQFKTQCSESETKLADRTQELTNAKNELEKEKQEREHQAVTCKVMEQNTTKLRNEQLKMQIDHHRQVADLQEQNLEAKQAPPAAAPAAAPAESTVIDLTNKVEKLQEQMQELSDRKESVSAEQESSDRKTPFVPKREKDSKKKVRPTYLACKHDPESFECRNNDEIPESVTPEEWPLMVPGNAYTWDMVVTFKQRAKIRLGIAAPSYLDGSRIGLWLGDDRGSVGYSADRQRWFNGKMTSTPGPRISSEEKITAICDLTDRPTNAGVLKFVFGDGKEKVILRGLNDKLSSVTGAGYKAVATMVQAKVTFSSFRDVILEN
jgi:hypothetical protein